MAQSYVRTKYTLSNGVRLYCVSIPKGKKGKPEKKKENKKRKKKQRILAKKEADQNRKREGVGPFASDAAASGLVVCLSSPSSAFITVTSLGCFFSSFLFFSSLLLFLFNSIFPLFCLNPFYIPLVPRTYLKHPHDASDQISHPF